MNNRLQVKKAKSVTPYSKATLLESHMNVMAAKLEGIARQLRLLPELTHGGTGPAMLNESESPFSILASTTEGEKLKGHSSPERAVRSLLRKHRTRAKRKALRIYVSPQDYAILRTMPILRPDIGIPGKDNTSVGKVYGTNVFVMEGIEFPYAE